jgi:hypothetical protein|tara:strand:+ start:760 stop:1116 length:357 start_codon:yes stop_codon:yes gene_type:complete
MADELATGTVPDVLEVDLAKEAGITTDDAPVIEGLITFDQLVMNFLQQHETAKDEYQKLQEALDNMHYTSTITKISLEELQTKKDLLNKLSGAVEALALYKKHVDPDCSDRDFVFSDD